MSSSVPKSSAPISMVTWLNEAVDSYRIQLQAIEKPRIAEGRRAIFTSTFDDSSEEKLMNFMDVWNRVESQVWTEAIGYILKVFSILGRISKSPHVPQMSLKLDRLYGVIHSTLMVGFDLSQNRQVTTLLESLGHKTRDLEAFEEGLGPRFWIEAFDIYAGVSWELVKYCTQIIQQDTMDKIWSLRSPDAVIQGYIVSFFQASSGGKRLLEEEQEEKEKEDRAKAEEAKIRLEEFQLLVKWLQGFVADQGGRGHDNVKIDRQADTGKWFLDKVRSWVVSSRSPVFWAEGRPGVGKSVLISHVIDEFQAAPGNTADQSDHNNSTSRSEESLPEQSAPVESVKEMTASRIAYFYFDYASRDRYSTRAVYSSLLLDLVSDGGDDPTEIKEGSIAAKVKNLREKCLEKQQDPTTDELRAILREPSKKVIIVFDALDEAHPDVRRDIVKWITEMDIPSESGTEQLRMLLTTRPDVIRPTRPGLITLLTVESKDTDMELYVYTTLINNENVQRVIKLKKKKKTDAFLSKLVTSVVKRAERMFLLAVLGARAICAQITQTEMEDAASTTDSDPGQIYTSTWNQISKLPEAQAEWAYKTISWLTFSRETLSLNTLTEALAVKPGVYKLDHGRKPIAEALTQACRGLVIFEDRLFSSRLRLAHQTVQEHFLQELPKRRFVHLDISLTCFTYLTLTALPGGRPSEDADDDDDEDDDEEEVDSDSDDTDSDQANGRSDSGSSPADDYLDVSQQRFLEEQNYTEFLAERVYTSDSLGSPQFPSYHNFDDELESMRWPIDLEGWVETKHLFSSYAESYGLKHLRAIDFSELQQTYESNSAKLTELEELRKMLSKVLLDFIRTMFSRQQRSTMDSTKNSSAQQNPFRMKPLHLAVLFGDLETVISVYREIYCEIDDRDEYGRTALSWALKLSSPSELIQFLLNEGADVNALDSQQQPAFYYASNIRSLPLLKSMLSKTEKRHINVDTLQAAAEANNTILMELLLETGINPDFCFISDGKSPLLAAAAGGYFEACDLLIKNNALVSTQNRNGTTPLCAAVMAKNSIVTGLLLRRDTDPNVLDKNMATPLHHAALVQDFDIISMLVKKGSKVEVQDSEQRTPLMNLLEKNNSVSEADLLKHSKKLWPTEQTIALTNKDGQSVYHLALQKGFDELVKKFVTTSCAKGLDLADSRGYVPLALAVESGSQDIIDFFLKCDKTDLTVRTGRNFNLFKLAVEASRPKLACQLLNIRPAWANELVEDNIPPMWIVAGRFAYPDVCLSLLTHGCDPIAKRIPSNDTGIMLASIRGHDEVMDILLDVWAWLDNPDQDGVLRAVVDYSGMNTLHHAISGGSIKIVEKLWNLHGLGKDSRDHAGNGVLHFAVRSGRAKMVELLLEKGANLNDSAHSGKKPLDDAIALGNRDIISALLAEDDVQIGMRYSEQAPDIVRWMSESWYLTLLTCLRRRNAEDGNSAISSSWIRDFVTIKKNVTMTQDSPDRPYLEVTVPGTGVGNVRYIAFRTVSHDQGWSDGAGQYGGSYNYTSSWFEVGIEPADPNEPTQAIERKFLQYNVNASSAWRTHYNIWDYRDTSPGLQDWLGALRGGDKLQLYVKARWPGWENIVAEADIEIYCETAS